MTAQLLGPPRDERDLAARTLVERCAYGAAALFLLPGMEVLAVVPIHVAMVIGVGEAYGVQVSRQSALALVTKLHASAGKRPPRASGASEAAPETFASTVALGTVARLYYERHGEVTDGEVRALFVLAADRARDAFDPARTRDATSKAMAARAAKEAKDERPRPSARPRGRAATVASRLAELESRRAELGELEFDQRRDALLAEL